MTSPATNRQFLLQLAKATLEALRTEPSALESVTEVYPDAVKNSLEAALDWSRMEESVVTLEAVAPSTAAEPYIQPGSFAAAKRVRRIHREPRDYRTALRPVRSRLENHRRGEAESRRPWQASLHFAYGSKQLPSRIDLRTSSGNLNSAFCRVSTPITAMTVPGARLAASSATGPAHRVADEDHVLQAQRLDHRLDVELGATGSFRRQRKSGL